MEIDKENQKTKGKNANVNALNTFERSPQQFLRRQVEEKGRVRQEPAMISDSDSKFQALLQEMQSMNVNMEQDRRERKNEMDEMRGKILTLEKKLEKGSNQDNGNRWREIPKCQNCQDRKVYCTHCAKCGEGGHKQRDCPKNE